MTAPAEAPQVPDEPTPAVPEPPAQPAMVEAWDAGPFYPDGSPVIVGTLVDAPDRTQLLWLRRLMRDEAKVLHMRDAGGRIVMVLPGAGVVVTSVQPEGTQVWEPRHARALSLLYDAAAAVAENRAHVMPIDTAPSSAPDPKVVA